jgi:hypothetical protein
LRAHTIRNLLDPFHKIAARDPCCAEEDLISPYQFVLRVDPVDLNAHFRAALMFLCRNQTIICAITFRRAKINQFSLHVAPQRFNCAS